MNTRKGSYRASSKYRKEHDHYPTYYSITEQLLEKEDFPEKILEPCCGQFDTIGTVLRKHGHTVTSMDLFFGPQKTRQDFTCYSGPDTDGLITNPPFKIADAFLTKSLDIVRYKFALLLPLDYLHGKDRYDNFYSTGVPLHRVYTLVRRPLFGGPLRKDGKYTTGSTTFSWFVFDKGYKGPPIIDWIDNSRYILDKNDKKDEIILDDGYIQKELFS